MQPNTLILRSQTALENLNRIAEEAHSETSRQESLRRLGLVSSAAKKIGDLLSRTFGGSQGDDPDNLELLRLANQASAVSILQTAFADCLKFPHPVLLDERYVISSFNGYICSRQPQKKVLGELLKYPQMN